MVGPQNVNVQFDALDAGHQFAGQEKVVQPGPPVICAIFIFRPPPGIGSLLLRVQCAECVYQPDGQQLFKSFPNFGRKKRIVRLVLLVFRVAVYPRSGRVEISAEDDGLAEFRHIFSQPPLPFQPVVRAVRGIVGVDVRHISIDEIEVLVLQRNQASFTVKLWLSHSKDAGQRLPSSQRQSAGVARTFCRVPILQIAGCVEVALGFDLLAAYHVWFRVGQEMKKSFPATRFQPVHVPAYDLHTSTPFT